MDYKEEIEILHHPEQIKSSSFNPNVHKKSQTNTILYIRNQLKNISYTIFLIILISLSSLVFAFFINSNKYYFIRLFSPGINFDYYRETDDDYNIVQLNNDNDNEIKNVADNENKTIIELPKETYNLTDGFTVSTFLTRKTINKYNNFINTCLNGTLIDSTPYPLLTNPKISVTIPIYTILYVQFKIKK